MASDWHEYSVFMRMVIVVLAGIHTAPDASLTLPRTDYMLGMAVGFKLLTIEDPLPVCCPQRKLH